MALPWNVLDGESTSRVFKFLNLSELFKCRLVCRRLTSLFASEHHAKSVLQKVECELGKATYKIRTEGRLHDSTYQSSLAKAKADKGTNVYHKTITICHKGCSSKFHGNTMPAFKESVRIGAEMIELDLILTRDRNIIIHHDQTTPDGEGLCFETPMSEIRRKFPEIPTLREFLENDMLRKSDIRIYFDLKCQDIVEPLLELLMEAVHRLQWDASRFLIASFDQYDLLDVNAFKSAHDVDFQTIVIVDAMPLGYAACFEELEVAYISIAQGRLIPAFVQDAHRRGMGVFAWTVNDPVLWRAFVRMGVDGICTDRPAEFQADLKAMAQCAPTPAPTPAAAGTAEARTLAPADLYPRSLEAPRQAAIAALAQARALLRFCTLPIAAISDAKLADPSGRLGTAAAFCEEVCRRYLEPSLISPAAFERVLAKLQAAAATTGGAGRRNNSKEPLAVQRGSFPLAFEAEWVAGLASQGLLVVDVATTCSS